MATKKPSTRAVDPSALLETLGVAPGSTVLLSDHHRYAPVLEAAGVKIRTALKGPPVDLAVLEAPASLPAWIDEQLAALVHASRVGGSVVFVEGERATPSSSPPLSALGPRLPAPSLRQRVSFVAERVGLVVDAKPRCWGEDSLLHARIPTTVSKELARWVKKLGPDPRVGVFGAPWTALAPLHALLGDAVESECRRGRKPLRGIVLGTSQWSEAQTRMVRRRLEPGGRLLVLFDRRTYAPTTIEQVFAPQGFRVVGRARLSTLPSRFELHELELEAIEAPPARARRSSNATSEAVANATMAAAKKAAAVQKTKAEAAKTKGEAVANTKAAAAAGKAAAEKGKAGAEKRATPATRAKAAPPKKARATTRRVALEEEDAVAAEILAAYPDGPCSWARLERLLERGGRARRHRGPTRTKPALLGKLAAGCAFVPPPELPSLDAGDFDGESVRVLSTGNGDCWICSARGRDPLCAYFDHEEGGVRDEPSVPLSQLLAGYLLMHELIERELDHPELGQRLRTLIPAPWGLPSPPL